MNVYALRLKDKIELKESSSGGAFTAFSDVFIEKGNAIVSAVYNYQSNQMEFMLYTTKEQRNKARGSKYIQAYPMNSFKEAEIWIKQNKKKILFVGTGCQAEGFRKYAEIKKIRDKTLIIDIICHGTPSPQLWKKYIDNKNIEYLTFKDKRNGWRRPTAYALYEGKEEAISDYVSLFYKSYALRPSCYKCPFATMHRNVDITIGDFWGIENVMPEFFSEEGNSLVFIHTERGKEIFELIKDKIEWKESDELECIQPNLLRPTDKPLNREKFWKDFKKKGITYVLKKYTEESFLMKIRRRLNEITHKLY